jgi:hypothetical protein
MLAAFPAVPLNSAVSRSGKLGLRRTGEESSLIMEASGHCCVVRSRRAGDWFCDVVWLVFGVRWLPVPAGPRLAHETPGSGRIPSVMRPCHSWTQWDTAGPGTSGQDRKPARDLREHPPKRSGLSRRFYIRFPLPIGIAADLPIL